MLIRERSAIPLLFSVTVDKEEWVVRVNKFVQKALLVASLNFLIVEKDIRYSEQVWMHSVLGL